MTPIRNSERRFWRTDIKQGRGVYALISNDVNKPSEHDPLVGVMESAHLAEDIVELHNRALAKYGRHYLRALTVDEGGV